MMGSLQAADACLLALAVSLTACGFGAPSGMSLPVPMAETMKTSAASKTSPVGKAPVKTAPAKTAPAKTAPAKTAPAKTAPAKAATKADPAIKGKAVVKPPAARPPAAKPRILAARVDSTALEFAVTARLAHQPLTRAIARRTRNPAMAERAAWAVTREAGRIRVSPSLLAAVLLIENRQLDSMAVSSQGAIGLMQVMPMHAGSYGCGSDELTEVNANICHGASVLHLYLVRSRSVSAALRRYNGCVRGANTPRCSRYPMRVLQTAARLRRDILASATEADRRVRM
jgi:soluble lytic murein transglycosylase-like protein